MSQQKAILGKAPTISDIERLAAESFAGLPEEVRFACADLAIQVADFADDDVLDEMGLEDGFELTGLYQGVPLTEKSVSDSPQSPDIVWLYRRPVLDEWAERGDVTLADLVHHILVHEIAHHLGWSDDDIRAIDDWTA